jgi:hypothetical protein
VLRGGVIDEIGSWKWPYTLGIVVADENVCPRPRYPAPAIKVLQGRNTPLKEFIFQGLSVAESAARARMRAATSK